MAGVKLTDPTTQNPFTSYGTVTGGYGIYGTAAAAWRITNHGKITGTTSAGITLAAGGSVTNGAAGQTGASITGLTAGVLISGGPGTVVNYGTIATAPGVGSTAVGVEIAGAGSVRNLGAISGARTGVRLDAGGSIVNGSATQTSASIKAGFVGVAVYGGAGTLTNLGVIAGGIIGVNFAAGGVLVNGSNGVTTASITGAFGFWGGATPTVSNYGTITGTRVDGMNLFAGGTVINGSVSDRTARIDGYQTGFRSTMKPTTLVNFGTIIGQTYQGVLISGTGRNSVTNGSASDTTALITSLQKNGVYISGSSATVTNFATISGTIGVSFFKNTKIETVYNAGTIIGTRGTAISFGAGKDLLVVAPGAVFVGKVVGGSVGNTLELASAASSGTIGGIGTSFTNFGTLTVDTRAAWHLTGSNSLAGGSTIALGRLGKLTTDGTLTVGGSLTLKGPGDLAVARTGRIEIGTIGGGQAGRITIDRGAVVSGTGTLTGGIVVNGSVVAHGGTLGLRGAVTGTGTVAIDSGSALSVGTSLRASHIQFLAGTSETLLLGKPSQVTGTIAGFGTLGANDRIDLVRVVATGSAYSGGVLTVSSAGGVATLHFAGSYRLANFSLSSDGHGGTNIRFV